MPNIDKVFAETYVNNATLLLNSSEHFIQNSHNMSDDASVNYKKKMMGSQEIHRSFKNSLDEFVKVFSASDNAMASLNRQEAAGNMAFFHFEMNSIIHELSWGRQEFPFDSIRIWLLDELFVKDTLKTVKTVVKNFHLQWLNLVANLNDNKLKTEIDKIDIDIDQAQLGIIKIEEQSNKSTQLNAQFNNDLLWVCYSAHKKMNDFLKKNSLTQFPELPHLYYVCYYQNEKKHGDDDIKEELDSQQKPQNINENDNSQFNF